MDLVSEASEEITVRYTGGPWKLQVLQKLSAKASILLPLSKQALLKGIVLRGWKRSTLTKEESDLFSRLLGALEISYLVRMSHDLGPGSPPSKRPQVGACKPHGKSPIYRRTGG